ncbi:SusD/RagB family nutrient-binding outer membrane lipoprotein [Niabella pedocola]|uniref:SusD/RagB family nutrient-binding outer membrane lipoprotein n=1 Tax=Niabella pedocola TaxID=1752077 RepID=A0ABS8PUB7_9BACT|nr:SusD/RagB family nutrient-binding outer membrane lipoprotein [Niabella pedocola]MCD2424668.1 SusD/RagB family nutrient-binding outer membrane lipoprotein [Niabella pedocola]
MKLFLKYITIPLVTVTALVSCTQKFDEINTNPDKSTTSTDAWLATNMITSITSSDITSTKGFCQPFMLSKYVLWTENQVDFQYNKIARTGFGRLSVLRNVAPMLNYAATEPTGIKNAYSALAHFIRAWQFYQLSMQVGDIPYSDALKGQSDGIIKPKYDSQKDVFKGILNELDSANTLFASGTDFSGDFIYSGSVDKWRRLTNTFELHVLMQLHKKTGDADLNVISRFKDIVANRPLMRDYNDNFAVKYVNTAGYAYPWSNTPIQLNSFTIYPMVGATLITPLKNLQDRRLFYYAEPAPTQITAGKPASDWDAYIGVEASDPFSSTTAARAAGKFCDFNNRYKDLFNAEPVGLLNYWDLQFILAEATVRGWITGTGAQSYYAAGIQSSMNFLVNYTPAAYTHGMAMDATYIANYPTTAAVALTGNSENQIKQIITQKYLAGFLQGCDYNAWYENRRTGYPAFVLNSATNRNLPATQFPVRWLYPQSELDVNADNVAAAIQSQYGGSDDANQVMWLLK